MKECILVGGGTSVKHGIDIGLWDKIKRMDVWSINFAFMTMPYLPSREVWVDKSFFKLNIDALEKLYRKGVPCYTKSHPIYKNIPEIHTYHTSREVKDFPDKTKMFSGQAGLSGTFALCMAVREQYDKVYLLGYDFGTQDKSDKNTHYYQHYLKVHSEGFGNPEVYRDAKNKESLHKAVTDYQLFVNNKTDIINVSPNSNIPYFKKISYEQFFEQLHDKTQN